MATTLNIDIKNETQFKQILKQHSGSDNLVYELKRLVPGNNGWGAGVEYTIYRRKLTMVFRSHYGPKGGLNGTTLLATIPTQRRITTKGIQILTPFLLPMGQHHIWGNRVQFEVAKLPEPVILDLFEQGFYGYEEPGNGEPNLIYAR